MKNLISPFSKTTAEADMTWLSDPETCGVNRIRAHSDHLFFTGETVPANGQSNLKQSLNGQWLFSYSKKTQERPADFYRQDYDLTGFVSIQVPGHMELQGYGSCHYVNTMYPWDGSEAVSQEAAPEKNNAVGSYVTFFDVNPALTGKRTFLSFQGAEAAIYVWLNGSFVGYSEDSFTPSEFDITEYLQETNNKLAVEVWKRSSASWLEDQDFWRFSGLFREVFLYAIPELHLFDWKLAADCDYVNHKAAVTHSLHILGNGSAASGTLKIQWKNADGVPFGEAAADFNLDSSSENSGSALILSQELTQLSLWSAESPYLYAVSVYLYDEKGKLTESSTMKYGFRHFEIKDKIMLLNGKRILFHGVNRHEFHPASGRCISEEDMLFDVKFMKQNNINAVRTCHYPDQSRWYQLCDEYGIYMMDEINLETHGTWQKLGYHDCENRLPGNRKEWETAILDRAESMYERDKNHPAILLWSLGNESHGGSIIAAASDYLRKKDRRPISYEGVFYDRAYENVRDIEGRNYADPRDIEAYLTENPGKPYLNVEYMHAMNNSLGGMKLYADLEDKYPLYQGGFIWDYIDQALWKEENGQKVLAYGGDFDDRPTDYQFCGNGILYADRSPSPKVQEMKYFYQSVRAELERDSVTVENRNLFLTTEGYDFVLCIANEKESLYEQTYHFSVPPLEKAEFSLELPTEVLSYQGFCTYTLSFRLKQDCPWAKKGHEIGFAQRLFGQFSGNVRGLSAAEVLTADSENSGRAEAFTVVSGDYNLGVHGTGFSFLFSKKEGGLVSMVYDGQEYLKAMPRPIFTRAYTDNDKGCGMDYDSALWEMAGKHKKCTDFNYTQSAQEVSVNFTYEFPHNPVKLKLTYQVTAGGTLTVHYQLIGEEAFTLPLYGLEWKLPVKFDRFRYLGRGPEENYIDRNLGARVGVYEQNVIDNLTPYLVPQECGHRTELYSLDILDEAGAGIRFCSIDKPFEGSVLPYSAEQLDQAGHHYELPASSFTYIRILGEQMGVGGDDSWGARVHEEYLIRARKEHNFAFRISPLSKDENLPFRN